MRYLVLGAGTLGGYFGGMLINGGADVTFLVRPKRAAQLHQDGLVVKLQDGSELRTKATTVQQGHLNGTYDENLEPRGTRERRGNRARRMAALQRWRAPRISHSW